jgi:response regulator RpfG family c-di-GMP phosphodiesterase
MLKADNYCLLLLSDKKSHLSLMNSLLSTKKIPFRNVSSEKETLQLLTTQKVGFMLWDSDFFYNFPETLRKEIKNHDSDAIHIILTDKGETKKTKVKDNDISIYQIFDTSQDQDILMQLICQGIEKYKLVKENKALHSILENKEKKMREVNALISKKLSSLNSYFDEKHKILHSRNRRLKRGLRSTIEMFSSLTDIRNGRPNHCRNVAYLCRLTSEALSLKDEEINTIEVAALLHDIGKVAIDESIVKKSPCKRTSLDEKHIRMHPVRGQAAVECIDGFKEVGRIIRHHHEHYDGTGYPDRLKGKEIPLGSCMIAIADRIDNVANSLKHWDKYSLQRALWSVESRYNSIYDPNMYKIMASVIQQWLKTLLKRGRDDMALYFLDDFIENSAMPCYCNDESSLKNILRDSHIESINRNEELKGSGKDSLLKPHNASDKELEKKNCVTYS